MTKKAPHPRSVDGFCARNGIGRTKFYKEVEVGELEVTKVGTRTLVTPEQETAWLERKRGGQLGPPRGIALKGSK